MQPAVAVTVTGQSFSYNVRLTMKQAFTSFSCSFLLAIVTACGGAQKDFSAYDGAISAEADAVAGKEVFLNQCSGCHPGGEKGKGPQLKDAATAVAKARGYIREGDGWMPAFPADRISDPDLENLLAYMRDDFGMFGGPTAAEATPSDDAAGADEVAADGEAEDGGETDAEAEQDAADSE